jgi:hypothetical protein
MISGKPEPAPLRFLRIVREMRFFSGLVFERAQSQKNRPGTSPGAALFTYLSVTR